MPFIDIYLHLLLKKNQDECEENEDEENWGCNIAAISNFEPTNFYLYRQWVKGATYDKNLLQLCS